MKLLRTHPSNGNRRGYTLIEIVMAMGILAVGVSGLIAMQKVTVTANRHSKNLTTASHIAQSWLTIIEAEAVTWASITSGPKSTDWHAIGLGQSNWFRPTYSAARDYGPAFDALGNPLIATNNARYCADLRVKQLNNTTVDPIPKSGLVRVEVRVAWIQDQTILGGTPASACGINAFDLTEPAGISEMNFVHMATAIRTVERLNVNGQNN